VLVPEMRDGSTLLSLRDAVSNSAWKDIEDAYKNKTDLAVFAKNITSSGVSVDVNGIVGFVPVSQLSKEFNKESETMVGKYFKVLKDNYSDTEYFKEILNECGYFKTYMEKK
jgi:ribosomal protein S1